MHFSTGFFFFLGLQNIVLVLAHADVNLIEFYHSNADVSLVQFSTSTRLR